MHPCGCGAPGTVMYAGLVPESTVGEKWVCRSRVDDRKAKEFLDDSFASLEWTAPWSRGYGALLHAIDVGAFELAPDNCKGALDLSVIDSPLTSRHPFTPRRVSGR